MKLNFKERKGITLIALVITIVILLILAGITINSLTGENGLFTNAKKSSEETKKQSALEELNLKIMDVQTIKNGEVTLQDIVEALKNDEQYTYIVNLSETAFLSNAGDIASDSDITEKITNDVTSIIVIHKGYEFEINNNLKVSYIGTKGEQQKENYTISLDANGGTITENEIKIMNGDLYGDLPEPTRENCNFEGWYTSKKVSEGTKIEATDEFSLKEDQTLYAIWSHTHSVESGATLISGTALGDDGVYSLSGGCYTTSNSYSATCGSGNAIVVGISDGSVWSTSQRCCYHTSTYANYSGTITVRCTDCGTTRSSALNNTNYCPTCYVYFDSYTTSGSLKYGHDSGLKLYQPVFVGYCSATISKTKYQCGCGMTSGILDQ